MRKFFFLFALFAAISLFAIEIDIKPDRDNNISVTNIEKDAFKTFIKKMMNFELTDEGAYKLVRENRALANEYLKRKGLDRNDIARIKTEVEFYLSTKFIKDIQRSIKIPEKVLLSYYLDNKKAFKKEPSVDTVAFYFKKPSDALDFYYHVRSEGNFEKAKAFAKKYEKNVVIKDYGYKNIKEFKKDLRQFVQEQKKSGYFLPPFIYSPDFAVVFYVRGYKPGEGYYSFDEVREKIKHILHDKTFLKKRRDVLKKYGITDEK